jgi:uncharacterized protein (TIGR02118 family)
MIKVSALYPNQEGSSFDLTYYLKKHIPMVKDLLGARCKNVMVEQGIAGGTPGSQPAYTIMGHLFFDSVEDFMSAFGPNAEVIVGDVPNFSSVSPVLQVSEVKL